MERQHIVRATDLEGRHFKNNKIGVHDFSIQILYILKNIADAIYL